MCRLAQVRRRWPARRLISGLSFSKVATALVQGRIRAGFRPFASGSPQPPIATSTRSSTGNDVGGTGSSIASQPRSTLSSTLAFPARSGRRAETRRPRFRKPNWSRPANGSPSGDGTRRRSSPETSSPAASRSSQPARKASRGTAPQLCLVRRLSTSHACNRNASSPCRATTQRSPTAVSSWRGLSNTSRRFSGPSGSFCATRAQAETTKTGSKRA
jgi:hypothetical protein